jgi:hypothetical protein
MNFALPVRLKKSILYAAGSEKPGRKAAIFLTVQFLYRKKPKVDHYIYTFDPAQFLLLLCLIS